MAQSDRATTQTRPNRIAKPAHKSASDRQRPKAQRVVGLNRQYRSPALPDTTVHRTTPAAAAGDRHHPPLPPPTPPAAAPAATPPPEPPLHPPGTHEKPLGLPLNFTAYFSLNQPIIGRPPVSTLFFS